MAGVVKASSILDMAQRDIDLYVRGTVSSAAGSTLACAPADFEGPSTYRTYDINVKAHYYTVQAFLPHMLEEGHGHVVVSSHSMSRRERGRS